MIELDPVKFNYDIDVYHCKDCKYSKWYSDGKRYGCPDGGMQKICGSFVLNKADKEAKQ